MTGFFDGVGVGFAVALGVAFFNLSSSEIVTFNFCPGNKLSICTFAPEPEGFGAI